MSVRLNAAGFPLDLLENVCGELRAMVEKGVHPSMVTLSDRPAMPWARHKYIDASCAAFEKAREEETRQRFALEIASALIPKLEALPAFVENAACIRDTLVKLCPDMGEVNALRNQVSQIFHQPGRGGEQPYPANRGLFGKQEQSRLSHFARRKAP